jgi:hypothetical protein
MGAPTDDVLVAKRETLLDPLTKPTRQLNPFQQVAEVSGKCFWQGSEERGIRAQKRIFQAWPQASHQLGVRM